MKALRFSFIIPVFNRPDEINELLQSFLPIEGNFWFEVVIIEDGSTISAEAVVAQYQSQLNIVYLTKPNTGPGDSRNYGMKHANGDYFIILDSDCLLPPHYLIAVSHVLNEQYVDFFGGPDSAHTSFSPIQKAINFAMTAFITTGGVRGSKQSAKNFQPRSFNMGLSKTAFVASGGFGNIHPGEDPDLTIRLWELGYKSAFVENAFVYHKRRISWTKFYEQVYKFGLVRPILNRRYPAFKSLVFWFPTIFSVGFLIGLILMLSSHYLLIIFYAIYFLMAFISAFAKEKSLSIAILSMYAILVQFLGYGYGFLKSHIHINILNHKPENCFPSLYFKNEK